jgi:hypothetical protein
MTELAKLEKIILEYTRETGKKAKTAYSFGSTYPDLFSKDFVLWLASRPTCGVEQRKFLDEVEKGKLLSNYRGDGVIDIKHTTIEQRDFEARLEKVIKGE